MNTEWEKKFFGAVVHAYKDVYECSVENVNGKDLLNIGFVFRDDDGEFGYDGTVTVNDNGNTASVSLFIVLRDSVPEEKAGDVIRLVSLFNSSISIGSFGYIEEDGYVYFRCAYNVIPKDKQEYYESAFRTLNETSRTAVLSAIEADDYLEDLISGESTLDELIAEDACILQDYEQTEE